MTIRPFKLSDWTYDPPTLIIDDCPNCRGTGEGMSDRTVCTICRGKGTITRELSPIEEEHYEEED